MNHRVPVALMQQLRRKGNSINAFTIGINRGHSGLNEAVAAKTKEVLERVESIERVPDTAEQVDDFIAEAKKASKYPIGARAFVSTTVLQNQLAESAGEEKNPMTVQFEVMCAKVFVLHEILMHGLELTDFADFSDRFFLRKF